MQKKNEIWEHITRTLESKLGKSEFKIWFSHTKLIKLEPDLAVIEVSNKFVAAWLQDKYITEITRSFKKETDFLPKIHFIYRKPTENRRSQENGQGGELSGLDSRSTFANFITTNTNRFVYSCALKVASHPGNEYNPLFLFSDQSLGKTHLLHAVGNHALHNDPSLKVRYVRSEHIPTKFSLANKENPMEEVCEDLKNADVLLFDDIHRLEGREQSQRDFSSIFDAVHGRNKQMVLASKKPPGLIQGLIPSLRSRLEWGLVLEIPPADQKAKMSILREKVRVQNLSIPEDVLFFVANSTHDLKHASQALIGVASYASLSRREINISMARSILKNRHTGTLELPDIQKVSADYFNIPVSDLLSSKKTRRFSYPRQVAMYLSKRLTNLSYKEIGKAFGNKDHSTIIYAVNHIEKLKESSEDVFNDIQKLQSLL